jgi:hypothetical protein
LSNAGGPGDPADPASWNRYAYTEADPINYLDPGGTTKITGYYIPIYEFASTSYVDVDDEGVVHVGPPTLRSHIVHSVQ